MEGNRRFQDRFRDENDFRPDDEGTGFRVGARPNYSRPSGRDFYRGSEYNDRDRGYGRDLDQGYDRDFDRGFNRDTGFEYSQRPYQTQDPDRFSRASWGQEYGQDYSPYRTDYRSNDQNYASSWGTGSSQGYGSSLGRANPSSSGRAYEEYRGEPNYREGRHAGKGPKDYKRSDDRIREDVCEALARDPHIDASEISVKVKDGVVTLTGTVEDRRAKRRAEDCAEDVNGVKDIINSLSLQEEEQEGMTGSNTVRQSQTRAGKTGRSRKTH